MKKLALFSVVILASCPLSNQAKDQGHYDADEYAQNSAPQFINSTKQIHLLDLKGNESVLDFGCRDGRITNHILEKYLPFGTIHGIDSSAEFIQHAQQCYTQNSRLSFEQVNVPNYAPTKKYDTVTSFMLLHWVEEFEKTLQVIFDALKPGGKALIMTLSESEQNFLKAIKEILQEEPWKNYGKNYQFPIYTRSYEQILSAAQTAGFNIHYFQLILNTADFKDESAYQHHYQATPLASCIPPEEKEAFFKQVAARALPHEKHNPDGSITVSGYALYMVLEKPRT